MYMEINYERAEIEIINSSYELFKYPSIALIIV